MRRWLLLVIVLLLPLRGLVGEAMAGQMAVHAAAASEAAQASHHRVALPGHDCDEHRAGAVNAAEDAAVAATEAPADCPTCASCQVCSSVALGPSVVTATAAHAAQPRPQTVQRPHPSADAALAFKPPKA